MAQLWALDTKIWLQDALILNLYEVLVGIMVQVNVYSPVFRDFKMFLEEGDGSTDIRVSVHVFLCQSFEGMGFTLHDIEL